MHFSITVLVQGDDGGNVPVGAPVVYAVPGNACTITQELLADLSGVPLNQIVGCNLSVECVDALLEVRGLRYCGMGPFAGGKANVAHLQVDGCSQFCRVMNMAIGRADFERSNWLLVDSKVERLYVGIRTARDAANAEPPIQPAEVWSDLRDSDVGVLRIFVRQQRLEAKRSVVRHLIIEPGTASCTEVVFGDGSAVDRFSVSGSVGRLAVRQAILTDLYIVGAATIETLELGDSSVSRAHNCSVGTFTETSLDTWSLVQKSARAGNDELLHATAGYRAMESWRSRAGQLRGLPYLFLRVTCGYGYRPLWTVILAVLVILGCGFGFLGIWELDRNAIGYPGSSDITPAPAPQGLARVGSCLHLSVITFTTTGYGDLFPRSGYARLLAGLEAISGIVVVALLIFALTKRFGSLR